MCGLGSPRHHGVDAGSEQGKRRKEAVSEYATRTSGCFYLSMPGGEPNHRLTFMLRDLRAPGLLEVRGFFVCPANANALSGRAPWNAGGEGATQCITA